MQSAGGLRLGGEAHGPRPEHRVLAALLFLIGECSDGGLWADIQAFDNRWLG